MHPRSETQERLASGIRAREREGWESRPVSKVSAEARTWVGVAVSGWTDAMSVGFKRDCDARVPE